MFWICISERRIFCKISRNTCSALRCYQETSRTVGAVERELEDNIESIIMSLYETLVHPGTVCAVLALFIIKKRAIIKDIIKLRKCVENSDRKRIWNKKLFLYKRRLNRLVLQIVESWGWDTVERNYSMFFFDVFSLSIQLDTLS